MSQNSKTYRLQKRTEITERRARVAELIKLGRTQRTIANDLGVSTFTVSEDYQALLSEWKRQAGVDMAAHVAVALQKVDRCEELAMECFEESRKPKRVASAAKTFAGNGMLEGTTSAASQVERPEGDPRFLALVLKYQEQRLKILAMEAHREKIDENTTKQPSTFSEWVALELEKRDREREVRIVTPKAARPPVVPLNLP